MNYSDWFLVWTCSKKFSVIFLSLRVNPYSQTSDALLLLLLCFCVRVRTVTHT